MHIVLMAANASGIMQETKVGKEMILIWSLSKDGKNAF